VSDAAIEVVIDVTRLVGRRMQGRLPTGVDRVCLEYVRHFEQRAVAVIRYRGRWLEFSRSDSSRLFRELFQPSRRFHWWVRWLVMAAHYRLSRRAAGEPRFYFNTDHHGLDSPRYAALLKAQHLRPLFFVHDLIPISHPEYCRPGERERHTVRMDAVLKLGHGVITNSAATLAELARYAADSGVSLPPAVGAKLASAALPTPQATAPIAEPYFVMLSTIEPRKNHWLLLQVWRRLVERWGDQAPKLVVIGQRGWECENVVDLLERCEVLRDFVVELPSCSDQELATYLRHARALVFPSFAEGYGLPLVEALSLGVPVIASDLPAFHEIAGAIPDYLDPLDGPSWLAAIEAFALPDSSLRAAQLQRLHGFKAPSWSEHFALVDSLLDSLAPSRRQRPHPEGTNAKPVH